MSVHLSPAFRQQQDWREHALLHEHDSSSKTSSGAGFEPSNTKLITPLSTFQPCPCGDGISGQANKELLQIAAW